MHQPKTKRYIYKFKAHDTSLRTYNGNFCMQPYINAVILSQNKLGSKYILKFNPISKRECPFCLV